MCIRLLTQLTVKRKKSVSTSAFEYIQKVIFYIFILNLYPTFLPHNCRAQGSLHSRSTYHKYKYTILKKIINHNKIQSTIKPLKLIAPIKAYIIKSLSKKLHFPDVTEAYGPQEGESFVTGEQPPRRPCCMSGAPQSCLLHFGHRQ